MDLLTVTQAAKQLGISRARVHQYISAGRLPVIKAGGTFFINPASLFRIRNGKPGRPKKKK